MFTWTSKAEAAHALPLDLSSPNRIKSEDAGPFELLSNSLHGLGHSEKGLELTARFGPERRSSECLIFDGKASATDHVDHTFCTTFFSRGMRGQVGSLHGPGIAR